MSTNPFATSPKPADFQVPHNPSDGDHAAASSQGFAGSLVAGPPVAPCGRGWRFLRRVVVGAAVFLVLVCFVVCEVRHSHELYRMSRLVTDTEAQRRHCLERQRLGEAREARLQAALFRRHPTTPDSQVMKAGFAFQNRRHATIQLAIK